MIESGATWDDPPWLTAAGRMRAQGLAEVEAAKADGRWARARRG